MYFCFIFTNSLIEQDKDVSDIIGT
jgi:hypothetical protein